MRDRLGLTVIWKRREAIVVTKRSLLFWSTLLKRAVLRRLHRSLQKQQWFTVHTACTLTKTAKLRGSSTEELRKQSLFGNYEGIGRQCSGLISLQETYTGKDVDLSRKLARLIVDIVEEYGISDYPLGFECREHQLRVFVRNDEEANEWIQATANSFEADKQFQGLFENPCCNMPVHKPWSQEDGIEFVDDGQFRRSGERQVTNTTSKRGSFSGS